MCFEYYHEYMVAFYFLVMVCNASFQPYVPILPIFIAPKLTNFPPISRQARAEVARLEAEMEMLG